MAKIIKRNLQLSDATVRPIVPLVAPASPVSNPNGQNGYQETIAALGVLKQALEAGASQRDITVHIGNVRGHLNFLRAHHRLSSTLATEVSTEVDGRLMQRYDPTDSDDRAQRVALAEVARARVSNGEALIPTRGGTRNPPAGRRDNNTPFTGSRWS